MVSVGLPVAVTSTCPPICTVLVLLVDVTVGDADGRGLLVVGAGDVRVADGVDPTVGVPPGAMVVADAEGSASAAARLSAQALRFESTPHTTTSKLVVSALRNFSPFGVTRNPAKSESRSRSTLATYTPWSSIGEPVGPAVAPGLVVGWLLAGDEPAPHPAARTRQAIATAP